MSLPRILSLKRKDSVSSNHITSFEPASPDSFNPCYADTSVSRKSSLLNKRNSHMKRESMSQDAALTIMDQNIVIPDAAPPSPTVAMSVIADRRTSMLSFSSEMSGTVTPVDFPKDTPPEMVPVLTLLHTHKNREYKDGYLMILNDLNSGMLLCAASFSSWHLRN